MLKSKFARLIAATVAAGAASAPPARAQVIPPAGYIYSPQLLGSSTQSCVASGPAGTFVGVGPGFTANAQAVILVRESGASNLVALGFNSIGDCAYDSSTDTLYVTDNGGDYTGASTGDTVFRIASASTALAVPAAGAELVAAHSIPFAANVAIDSSGDVFVSESAGGGMGAVRKIDLPSITTTTFTAPFDFSAGVAFDPTSGDLLVAETRASFDVQIRRFSSAGSEILPVFAGPSFAIGSYDLAYDIDGNLLATGLFGGDVVSFTSAAVASPFVSGLNYATGVTVNGFTGRVEILSSTFSFPALAEDKTIHRFTPIGKLVEGGGSSDTDCLSELYGLEPVAATPGDPPKKAICVDGAACDADGTVNDRCLFPVGFCFNVADPDLADCAAAPSFGSISIATKPYSAAVAATNAAIQSALPAPSGCYFSDGMTVAVKSTSGGKRDGKGKIKVQVAAAGGRTDSDTIGLVCQPAP